MKDQKETFKVMKDYPEYLVGSFGTVKRNENIINEVVQDENSATITENGNKVTLDEYGFFKANLTVNGKTRTVDMHKMTAIMMFGYKPNGM